MKPLYIVVFLLSLLTLTTQAIRHIYVRFIEPRTSVLDQFDKSDAKKIIQEATSLTDLVREYESAKKHVDQLDEDLKRELAAKTGDDYDTHESKWQSDHEKEYEREEDLKQAIEDWEDRSKQILELRVFWFFGLVFFLLGVIVLIKLKSWLGMAFLIPGVVEMIWWTSPSFRFGGSPLEFDRLLNNKLGFTLLTLVILMAAWLLNERKDKKAF